MSDPTSSRLFATLGRSPLVRATLLAMVAAAALAKGTAAVQIVEPYARAMPPGQPNSAVFMTLSNHGSQARALIAAASPAAETVELHTHTSEGGIRKMRKIDRIEVPAGSSVTLEPGGLHVMLIGLKGTLEPGANVDLTLTFDDGSQSTLKAPVRRIQPLMQPTHQ